MVKGPIINKNSKNALAGVWGLILGVRKATNISIFVEN